MQMRDTLAAPPPSASKSKGAHRGSRPGRGGDGNSDSDETLSNGSSPNDVVPKEEGTAIQLCQCIPASDCLSHVVCLVFGCTTVVVISKGIVGGVHYSQAPPKPCALRMNNCCSFEL